MGLFLSSVYVLFYYYTMTKSMKRDSESFLWGSCIMQIDYRRVRIFSQNVKKIICSRSTEIRPAAQVVFPA